MQTVLCAPVKRGKNGMQCIWRVVHAALTDSISGCFDTDQERNKKQKKRQKEDFPFPPTENSKQNNSGYTKNGSLQCRYVIASAEDDAKQTEQPEKNSVFLISNIQKTQG